MLTAAVLGEESGIAVRNGRFCSHVHSSRLLGRDHDGGAVRASIGLYNDESAVDAILSAVEAVRHGRCEGQYEIRGDSRSARGGGRCADCWMEGAVDAGSTTD